MKTHARYRRNLLIVTVLVLLLLIVALVKTIFSGGHLFSFHSVNPHEGQVFLNDGFDYVWITPLKNVPASTLRAEDFAVVGNRMSYVGSGYTTLRGIDVSEHQREIDWSAVARDGIDFAYIRAGYRGYTEGALFTDAYFERNLKNAAANGLLTGVYFFSQAITEAEAIEEARYVLSLLDGVSLNLPVMYDWERMEGVENARTNSLDAETRTFCAAAFCRTINEAGHRAGIYFNRQLGYYGYDLSRLTDYSFWLTVPGSSPDFYYATDLWQYSFSETVAGISEPTDMNLLFIPVASPEPSPGT